MNDGVPQAGWDLATPDDFVDVRYVVEIPYRRAGAHTALGRMELPRKQFVNRVLELLPGAACYQQEVRYSVSDYPSVRFACPYREDALRFCRTIMDFLREEGYEPV